MKRRLIVMRHGHSVSATGSGADHSRSLDEQGCLESTLVATALVRSGWKPEQVLVSDSTRTRQTWAAMAEQFEGAVLRFTRALYLANLDTLKGIMGSEEVHAQQVLLIGHNPGCEELVAWLGGSRERMTTANAALLEAVGSTWAEALRPGRCQLHSVIRPKELLR